MIPYQKEKIENAICFFASEYRKRTNKHLFSIYLYKFLAILDFECIKENGKPSLGLKYMAMKNGPVPLEIYDNRKSIKSSCFAFKHSGRDVVNGKEIEKFIIIPQGKPDLDYFSDYEIDEMYRIMDIYADSSIDSKLLIDGCHESILAWQRAYRKKPNSIIDYADEFKGNIREKEFDKLTIPEENLLFNLSLSK